LDAYSFIFTSILFLSFFNVLFFFSSDFASLFMHTSPLQIHYLCHLPFVLTSNLSRGRIFRSREAIKIDTYPAAVRPSVLDAAVVPRVIDARIFTRAGKAGEPATETPQGDAEAGTIGGDGAAVRELVGGVDAERTVGWAGFKAKTAANLGFGGSFTAILWVMEAFR
jgi:hypothetical protein